jgi:hypothetical protein
VVILDLDTEDDEEDDRFGWLGTLNNKEFSWTLLLLFYFFLGDDDNVYTFFPLITPLNPVEVWFFLFDIFLLSPLLPVSAAVSINL